VILTVLLDEASQAWFDGLRRAHFPPERLVVGAHVTLFHALPHDADGVVDEVLRETAPDPSAVAVTGVRSLGRGVAFTLDAPGVEPLRAALADAFGDALTPQDRQPWRPHVTVQNKVTPAAAAALHARLSASFVPFEARAEGLELWHYRGGPWELAARRMFGQRPDAR